MKKLFKTMTLIFSCMLTIMSCTDDGFEDKSSGVNNVLQKEVFKFKYQGVQYAAEYDIVDSTMIFTDPEIADIICNLESDPYVATLTYPDGMVEYFNSNEELTKSIELGKISTSNVSSRVNYNVLVSLTLKVYEHADFQGDVLTFDGPFEWANIGAVRPPAVIVGKNWDNIISSFQLVGGVATGPLPPYMEFHHSAIVTFYEEPNFSYGSASFLIDRDHPQISHNNFKKVKRCSYCKYNMNDRTTSIRLSWVN